VKKFYSALILAIMIAFSGCTGASSENPTITLVGDREITLVVGQWFNEPGYSASDAIDGDLTNSVRVSGESYYNREGTYYITYSVQDSDGYTAEVTRTIIVGLADEVNNIGGIEYDLSEYYYNAYIDTIGNVVIQNVYDFDADGSSVKQVTFEKNVNDSTGYSSIYEFHYDEMLGRDVLVERDIIKEEVIDIVDYEDDNTMSVERYARINEPIATLMQNGVTMTCTLREYYPEFNTEGIAGIIGESLTASYNDVLRIQCTGTNGFISDTYLSKDWGEVLSVSSFNNDLEYTVPDKNFTNQ